MTTSMLKIITFVIVCVVSLSILIFVLINKKNSKYRKMVSFLDREKNLLESTSISSELAKIETIIKNERLEEKYKSWQDTFAMIKEVDISVMEDYLLSLDAILDKKEYDKFDEEYSKAELHLYKIKTKMDKLFDEIQEVNQSEEKYRDIITKLKAKYRELNSHFENNKESYEGLESIIELQFENIEKRFQDFEDFMEQNEYSEVIHIVKAIDTMVDHMEVVIEEAPDLILLATKVIPKRIEQINESYTSMKEENYPLDYLNVDYNVEESLKNVNKIFDRIKVLNLEDCMFELRTMLEYLDSLFKEFDKEKNARKEYEDAKDKFEKKLNKISKMVKDVHGEIDNIKNAYDLNERDVQNIDNVNMRLTALKKEYKKSLKSLTSERIPYSKISVELEEYTNLLKGIDEDLDVSLNSLGNMHDDEVRAHQQLDEIQDLLQKSKLFIRKYHLPLISNKYYVQLSEANDAIKEIIKELENKPIDIKTLNIRVDTARDLVLKLYKTTNEMIRNAKITEALIIYGNKYRSTSSEIDEGLKRAEQLFNKGSYNKALETVVTAIEIVDKEIKNKVAKMYVE